MSNPVAALPLANYPSYFIPNSLNIVSSLSDNSHLNKTYNDGLGFFLRGQNIDELLFLSTSSTYVDCIITDYM